MKRFGVIGSGLAIAPYISGFEYLLDDDLNKAAFGEDFIWGVAAAAYQTEGAIEADGKSESIWDRFTHTKGKIKTNENGDIACDYYNRYPTDIDIIKQMNFQAFRFSLAWSRIIPQGIGSVNQKGIDFYHRVIDKCLENDITPWITLYHWDLPQALEDKGGWTNREIINWFSEYVDVCTKAYGDKVKDWMILNEPLAFTAAGYFLGMHAPGRKGLKNFLPTVHHASMCQAEGGRITRNNVIKAHIGTTFSCSSIEPFSDKEKHIKAAERFDAIINRLYLEPALGLGYPVDTIKPLKRIYKYAKPGDDEKLKFDYDFIGLQNYTREIAKYSLLTPIIWGKQVPAEKRDVELTEMKWEVYPESIYKMIKKFAAYKGIKKIIVTENGAAFHDELVDNRVHDKQRIKYFKDYLSQILRAKKEGVNVKGYFPWSLTDNFEWAEGFHPRFGLVYIDFKTQQRIIKDSGYWFRDFLSK